MQNGLEQNTEEGVGDDSEEGRDLEDKSNRQGRGGKHAFKRSQQRLSGFVHPLHKRSIGRGTEQLEEDAQTEQELDNADNEVAEGENITFKHIHSFLVLV